MDKKDFSHDMRRIADLERDTKMELQKAYASVVAAYEQINRILNNIYESLPEEIDETTIP